MHLARLRCSSLKLLVIRVPRALPDERLNAHKYELISARALSDPDHRIVFHYTPKYCSWLSQIEIWFSVLARKVLRRGNLISTDDLRSKIHDFIDYFNDTLAKSFRWTYQAKPRAA